MCARAKRNAWVGDVLGEQLPCCEEKSVRTFLAEVPCKFLDWKCHVAPIRTEVSTPAQGGDLGRGGGLRVRAAAPRPGVLVARVAHVTCPWEWV